MEESKNGNPSSNYAASWEMISEKVEQILNPESKTTILFETLYSRVYRNVCDGFSEPMYLDLITLCSRHLNKINQQLCPPDEISIKHLLNVSSSLSSYLLSVKTISSVFSYLNKFFVEYYLNADLFAQLSGLFSQIIINHRLPALMSIVEQSYEVPFSIAPGVLHSFFNDLHHMSQGEYSLKYPHLFSKYCLNVLPSMKESDLENHIAEVIDFQQRLRDSSYSNNQGNHGLKRSAEEEVVGRRSNYQYLQPKSYPTTFH